MSDSGDVDHERVFRIERYDTQARHIEPAECELTWHAADAVPLRLSGFAWHAQDGIYRRLPKAPRHPLPEAVDHLANHTAGAQIAFRTDSPRLALRATLASPPDAWNMSPIGQCGFDCYLGEPGAAQYANTARMTARSAQIESWLYEYLPAESRAVTIHFPLYRGVKRLEVGIDPGARLSPPPDWACPDPVVVYGTSITQGASASRPGMAYTNLLSRAFNRPFINLGFSGSGKGEPELAHLINEIPAPAAYVLDFDSNIRSTAQLMERFPNFIRILRAQHPATPILVCSKPPFHTETHHPEVVAYRLERRDFLRQMVDRLREAGDARIDFQDGGAFYGDDGHECTVDQRHCNDLGFYRIAKTLEPRLRKLLLPN